MRQRYLAFVSCLLAAILPPLAAQAYVDPKFTPLELVAQSQSIVLGSLLPAKGGQWTLEPTEVLKGKAAGPAPVTVSDPQLQDLLRRNGISSVLLFSGEYQQIQRAYVSVGSRWLDVKGTGDGWQVEREAGGMTGTFAGGTQMLIRMVRYILTDPKATVPVSAGMRWMDCTQVGQVDAAITGLAAVELKADRKMHLFVGSPGGDRLYRPQDETMQDVTATVKLDTRSRQFVWTDLDGDGLADLVSWDGSAITVRYLHADGTLAPSTPQAFKYNGPCLGLAIAGMGDRPVLVISTDKLPILLDRQLKPVALPAGSAAAPSGGAASACIAADLDNDGHCDLLLPRAGGGILWKGTADGFALPVSSAVSADGGSRWALGDFDGDGFLDILVSGREHRYLWENDGKGGFHDVGEEAGSLTYKECRGASDCLAADLNHDGRTDLLLCSDDQVFSYHFNRGYRTLAELGDVRLTHWEDLPQLDKPQAHACAVADFNGDGQLDLAAAFVGGQVYCYYNDLTDTSAVYLRAGKALAGPITVSVWQGETHPLCMGTYSICGFTPASLATLRFEGACTLKYTIPDKGVITRTVQAGKKAAEVVLE